MGWIFVSDYLSLDPLSLGHETLGHLLSLDLSFCKMEIVTCLSP